MPRTVMDAMAAAADITDRGFTFVDGSAGEHWMSFQELARAARRRAGTLRALGLVPGDRIALIITEQRSFVVTFLAALAAQLVPVPVYPPSSLAKVDSWRQATEGIVRTARPAALVTTDEVSPLLWSVASRADTKIITLRQLDSHPGAESTAAGSDPDPDDVAFLQFTSGSTMAPRGVMVSHRNLVENCTRINDDLLSADITGVSWLPLYHDMGLIGMVLAPLLALRPIFFLDTLAFLKRPALWFDLIHRHRASATFAPHFAYPLAVRRISAAAVAGWDLSCLRLVGCGAEPIDARTLRTFAGHFAAAGLRPEALCPSYGLAEATLISTYTPVGEHWRSQIVDADRLQRHGEAAPPTPGGKTLEIVGCGTVVKGHSLRIIDPSGRALPERRVGEIELRGPSITGGYFADPAATARTFSDGAVRTGDLGYVADGHLFVTGRQRDLVIVHGRNYAAQTIEWALDGLSLVRAGHAVAFAYPDNEGVEQIAVVCESATRDVADVQHAVAARISEELGLAVGQVLVVRPGTLPKTSSGKVQRAKTRALFLDGTLGHIAQGKGAARRSRPLLIARLRWQAVLGSVRYRLETARRTRRQRATGEPR